MADFIDDAASCSDMDDSDSQWSTEIDETASSDDTHGLTARMAEKNKKKRKKKLDKLSRQQKAKKQKKKVKSHAKKGKKRAGYLFYF